MKKMSPGCAGGCAGRSGTAAALEHQGDLEMVVPVHRVAVAVHLVLEHREREAGVHLLLPDVHGHDQTLSARQPHRTGPLGVESATPSASGSRFCHCIDRLWHCPAQRRGTSIERIEVCQHSQGDRDGLSASVQPASHRRHGAAQPHRPCAHRHQLVARRRRGQRARHPSPRGHRPGGTGFVIVGATTPHMATGRPTVTCLVADGDNYIPGLARLAESMHRYGAKCAVQLQHPGRQSAIPRFNTLGATDRVLKLPWSAGHEIVYENADEKGKEIREASIPEIMELVDLFSEAAWRVKQAGFDAVELHAAHGYLLSRVHEPLPEHAHRPLRRQLREPHALPARGHRCHPARSAASPTRCWCATPSRSGARAAAASRRASRRRGSWSRPASHAVDLSMGMQESPGAGFDPPPYPQGWATYAAEATKKAVEDPGHHQPLAARSRLLRADPGRGQDRPGGPRAPAAGRPLLAGQGQYGRVKSIRRCISCLGGCWQESLMAQKEIACSINAACGDPALRRHEGHATSPSRWRIVGGGPAGMEAARIATERGHAGHALREARRAGRGHALRLPRAGQGEDALVPGLDPRPAARPRCRHPPEPCPERRGAARRSTSCSTPPAPSRTCPR